MDTQQTEITKKILINSIGRRREQILWDIFKILRYISETEEVLVEVSNRVEVQGYYDYLFADGRNK